MDRSRVRVKKPVPITWKSGERVATGHAFIPGIEDLGQGRGREPRFVEAIFDLEWLPEVSRHEFIESLTGK